MAGISSLLVFACFLFPNLNAQAQSRDLGAQALILDDGAGHSLRISVPTTGWTGLGQFEWVLPLPPSGLVDAGFVEAGTSTLTSLEWDDVGKYWKAVSGSGGSFIENQNAGAQAAANFNIDGSGTFGGLIALPATTATTGQLTLGGNPFLHGRGGSTFVGSSAGNFTMTGFNNSAVGTSSLLSNTSGNNNTAVGASSMQFNTTGGNNAALGTGSLLFNTTGYENSAMGSSALRSNTTGISNAALGAWALFSNTTGNSNTASGASALYANTTGTQNTAMGGNALQAANSFGNSGFGYRALASNTSGQRNTAVGGNAMQASTDVSNSVAVGYEALLSTTTGQQNTALGASALRSNTTGLGNVAVGLSALYTTNGWHNVAVGRVTMSEGATGNNNTAAGYSALRYNTADYNVAIGSEALLANTSGSYNTALGTQTNVASGTLTNVTVLGYQATATASNQIVLGNSSVTQILSAGGLLLNGTTGTTPTSGAGTRMMWIPAKMAFRAGDVDGTQWDDGSIGSNSIAMGHNTIASGASSVVLGNGAMAFGANTFAFGTKTSADHAGSMVFGDGDAAASDAVSYAANSFSVRASGGARFYSQANLGAGVQLLAGANAWSSISDSNRKENRLNISGEDVLNKLSNIWMGSWNYKSQDKSMRHYGPMAQEFFAAFGNDGLGVIGNDTTLATTDVDGVTLIAVKALIERNDVLESRVEVLEAVIRKLAIERETIIHRTMVK